MQKKTFYILAILLSFLVVNPVSAAPHELKTQDIHVFIHKDGSATITENRIANLSEGTENFIIIGNLGESTIQDFQVEENGRVYEKINDWDTAWTREEKAFKNGIIEKTNHIELVWGIGEYGEHTYELSYTVTDFIKQLDDSQMLFWQFVNSDTNIPPQSVTVTIETDEALSRTNERIWAFGFPGEIRFENDKIIARSDQPLEKSDYVTILTEFKNSSFATNDVVAKTFEEVKEEAFEDSNYTVGYSFLESLLRVLLVFGPIFGLLILIAFLMGQSKKRKIKKKYEGKFSKEPPFRGKPYMAYLLLNIYELADINHVISVFILKWIKEEHVIVETTTKRRFLRLKEISELHFSKDSAAKLPKVEAELYELLLSATDNGILKEKGLKKWAKKNHESFSDWQMNLINTSSLALESQGFIGREEIEYEGKKSFKTSITEKGKVFQDNAHTFKNYLENYSSYNEQKLIDVKTADELILWAAMLGITEEVYQQFKIISPEYEQETHVPVQAVRAAVRNTMIYHRGIKAGRSGGFGGSASGGGGGGSYGGGSGGGTR